MTRRRGHREPSPLGALIEGGMPTGSRSGIPPRVWEAAVGSRIAERARPSSLRGGVLTVRVASAAWAQELTLLSDPIRSELRRRGVAVDELRFRVGEIDPLLRPRERRVETQVPVKLALPPALAASVEAIEDPELRAAITEAIGRNLGFQLIRSVTLKARAASRDPRAAEGRSDPPDRSSKTPASGRRGKP